MKQTPSRTTSTEILTYKPLTDIELNAWLRSPGSQNYAAAAEIVELRHSCDCYRLWLTNATAQLDALRARRNELLTALEGAASGLKDVINAAFNNEPYTREELGRLFSEVVNVAEAALYVATLDAAAADPREVAEAARNPVAARLRHDPLPAPAPWLAVPRTDGLLNIYAGGSYDVALCVRPKDAPVVVAAPDMLNLLRRLIVSDTPEDADWYEGMTGDALDEARALVSRIDAGVTA